MGYIPVHDLFMLFAHIARLHAGQVYDILAVMFLPWQRVWILCAASFLLIRRPHEVQTRSKDATL